MTVRCVPDNLLFDVVLPMYCANWHQCLWTHRITACVKLDLTVTCICTHIADTRYGTTVRLHPERNVLDTHMGVLSWWRHHILISEPCTMAAGMQHTAINTYVKVMHTIIDIYVRLPCAPYNAHTYIVRLSSQDRQTWPQLHRSLACVQILRYNSWSHIDTTSVCVYIYSSSPR